METNKNNSCHKTAGIVEKKKELQIVFPDVSLVVSQMLSASDARSGRVTARQGD